MMKNKLIYCCTFLLILLGSNTCLYSQEIKAVLQPRTSGYQHILIPQEYTAIIGSDISKVRIKDQNGKEVPYIERKQLVNESTFKKEKYSLLKNDSTDIITIENTAQEKKQGYMLKITNTTATKNYAIEGSDDQRNWFSLVNKGTLEGLESNENTFVYKAIGFPLTSFKFIRIRVDNRNSAPIQLLDVGDFEIKSNTVQYEKLRKTSYVITTNEKDKTTTIEVSKYGMNPFDMINFHIPNKMDFYRAASIYILDTITTLRNGMEVHSASESNYFSFDLVSNQSNVFQNNFDLPKDKFYISIYNGMNNPLQIDSIELFQKPFFITANLNENETYTLEADVEWPLANYDINMLNLNLPSNLSSIEPTQLEWIPKDKAKDDGKESSSNNWILIVGLAVAVVIIFYFGQSLIKDMQKSK